MWQMLVPAMVLLTAPSFDSEMTKQEKKETGVSKLSRKEKKSLQAWIDGHYSAQGVPTPPGVKTPVKRPLVEENLQSGHYIQLTDKTIWEIHPQDIPITQGWLSPSEIVVTQTGNEEYPYTLTNSQTGSSVRARKVSEVPKASKTQAPKTNPPSTQPAPSQNKTPKSQPPKAVNPPNSQPAPSQNKEPLKKQG